MLSIGEFARYAGVSVRMLRHYDALGLLTPSTTDPVTGYRSYSFELLGRANAVVALKGLGFSLAEVGEIVNDAVDAQALRRLLERRRAELAEQIEIDQARFTDVERRLQLLDATTHDGSIAMKLEFTEKELPALELAQLTATASEQSEIGPKIGPMFEDLVSRILEAGEQPSQPGYAWYVGDGEAMQFGAGFARPIAGTETGHLEAAPRAITTVYHGAMDQIGNAWQDLGSHVASLGLEFAGPGREVYHDTQGPEETWVTELQQPVR